MLPVVDSDVEASVVVVGAVDDVRGVVTSGVVTVSDAVLKVSVAL